MNEASRLTHRILTDCRRHHWTVVTMRWAHHKRFTAKQVRRKLRRQNMKIRLTSLMERNNETAAD